MIHDLTIEYPLIIMTAVCIVIIIMNLMSGR